MHVAWWPSNTSCTWFNIPFIFHWLFWSIITLPSGRSLLVGNNNNFFSWLGVFYKPKKLIIDSKWTFCHYLIFKNLDNTLSYCTCVLHFVDTFCCCFSSSFLHVSYTNQRWNHCSYNIWIMIMVMIVITNPLQVCILDHSISFFSFLKSFLMW
jgi:hypothetical protein